MMQTHTLVADATVHGYAVLASGWAAGILVLAAVLAGLLIDVHPGQRVPEPARGGRGVRVARILKAYLPPGGPAIGVSLVPGAPATPPA